MNAVVPAGKPASVEVTYSDPSLFIGLQLFDDSGSSPTPIGSVEPMLNFAGVSYRAQVSGPANKWLLYQIAAYTDDTFETIDSTQPNGSGSLYFTAPELSGLELEAFVDESDGVTVYFEE